MWTLWWMLRALESGGDALTQRRDRTRSGCTSVLFAGHIISLDRVTSSKKIQPASQPEPISILATSRYKQAADYATFRGHLIRLHRSHPPGEEVDVVMADASNEPEIRVCDTAEHERCFLSGAISYSNVHGKAWSTYRSMNRPFLM
jgi:hypothetical protein